METGSSYRLVTGRDINVMSAATTVFGQVRSNSTATDIVRFRRTASGTNRKWKQYPEP